MDTPGRRRREQAGDLHARYHCLERQHRHRHHQPGRLRHDGDLANYALIGHGHEISDIAGLQEILDDYGDEIDLLSDLISGDMPGGITFSADFATLSNVTIIDGVWNQTARLIEA